MSKPMDENDKRKIRTMAELSAAIGVSRPTLSRYFQNDSSVRASTRQKIRAALEGVDYVPNYFATRMNRKSAGLIGVIVPYFNDLFFTSLLDAIELAALKAGFTMVTQSSHGDPAMEERAALTLLSMNVDGIVMAPLGHSSSVSALKYLSDHLPMVFVDSKLSHGLGHLDFVGTDNTQSVGLIVDYLCRTGSPPVFLSMPTVNSNTLEREGAYRSRMQILGHKATVIDSDVPRHTWNFEAYAHDVMDTEFAKGAFADATILCANDRLAIGVIRAAARHGLFGKDEQGNTRVRIAGHDDHPLSSFMSPTLTTVAQDAVAIGQAVVKQVVQRVRDRRGAGSEAVETRCKAVLRVRESA